MKSAIGAVAVGGGNPVDQRKANRVPAKRYAKPVIAVVKMDDVPEPPARNYDISSELYGQISSLKMGTALRTTFVNEKHADYVKGKLRSKAKKDKQLLGSSRDVGGMVRYFWLEKL